MDNAPDRAMLSRLVDVYDSFAEESDLPFGNTPFTCTPSLPCEIERASGIWVMGVAPEVELAKAGQF